MVLVHCLWVRLYGVKKKKKRKEKKKKKKEKKKAATSTQVHNKARSSDTALTDEGKNVTYASALNAFVIFTFLPRADQNARDARASNCSGKKPRAAHLSRAARPDVLCSGSVGSGSWTQHGTRRTEVLTELFSIRKREREREG